MNKEGKLKEKTVNHLLNSAIINGDLTYEDLKNEKKIKKFLKEIVKSKRIFSFVNDHSDTLLSEGYNYRKRKMYEYARFYYATYFEHTINYIIDVTARRNKWSDNVKLNIIRKIDIESKFTWLLELLNLPKFLPAHIKTIKQLSEKRNAFVHFKFKEYFDSAEETQIEIDEFNKIDKAVKYMKKYATKIVYKGSGVKIKGILKL